jgi:signal transduction histidine kinase
VTIFHSLRARLLAWSSALLIAALVIVGAWVVFSTWRAWLDDVDRGLETRLGALMAAVHPATDDAFDLALPPDALPNAERDYYMIWDAQGHLVLASDPDIARDRPAPGTFRIGDHREHVNRLANGVTVLVGRRIDDLTAEVRRLVVAMAGVGIAALGLVVVGGWWLIGRALAPVERIGHTARAMIDGDLSARIPVQRVESELEQLAEVLNEAFERQRRFTADASHDLRTPLATLQTEAHWALARPRSVDEYRASLEVCQRTATRMQALVQSLLDLSRAEAATGPERIRCLVPEVVPAVLEDLSLFASARRVRLEAGPLEGAVRADASSFRAALTNLVTNAIQYNVEGGSVHVTATLCADAPPVVQIEVRDTGAGLEPRHAVRVFDRFYRVDDSRDGRTGGAGLGLAVVAAFAQSHGGTVTVASAPGAGCTFTLRLPAD